MHRLPVPRMIRIFILPFLIGSARLPWKCALQFAVRFFSIVSFRACLCAIRPHALRPALNKPDAAFALLIQPAKFLRFPERDGLTYCFFSSSFRQKSSEICCHINYNIYLGQFTRHYTQTTKRGLLTTNKGWISSTGKVRDIQPVLLSGVSKGACPLAHDFARKV